MSPERKAQTMLPRRAVAVGLVGVLAAVGGVACSDEDGDDAGTDEEIDQIDEELEEGTEEAEEELEKIEDELDE